MKLTGSAWTGYASQAGPRDDAPPAVEVSSTSEGFDWASAAIGAAAGGGLVLLVVAGTVGMARRGRGPLVRRGALPAS
jgi:hypothetical protein